MAKMDLKWRELTTSHALLSTGEKRDCTQDVMLFPSRVISTGRITATSLRRVRTVVQERADRWQVEVERRVVSCEHVG
jgi:hypothetical protein